MKVTTTVSLQDDGTDDAKMPTGCEWGDRSWIACHECEHEGTVQGFHFPGLDDALEEARQETAKTA